MIWGAVGTFAVVVTLVVGLQSFWIGRALDRLDRKFDEVDKRFDEIARRFDRIEDRLDRIENNVLRDHGERIARLEAAQ